MLIDSLFSLLGKFLKFLFFSDIGKILADRYFQGLFLLLIEISVSDIMLGH